MLGANSSSPERQRRRSSAPRRTGCNQTQNPVGGGIVRSEMEPRVNGDPRLVWIHTSHPSNIVLARTLGPWMVKEGPDKMPPMERMHWIGVGLMAVMALPGGASPLYYVRS